MRRERLLQQGRFVPRSSRRSVLFFTVHKCASTFAPKALQYFNDGKDLKLTLFNLPTYVRLHSDQEPQQFMTDHAQSLFVPQGALYVPLRRFVDVPGMEHYATLLMLRDPRDVLVSSYYSVRFSHTLPFRSPHQAVYLKKRLETAKQTVDEYAIAQAERVRGIYSEYVHKLLSRPYARLLKYEDMIHDPEQWTRSLAAALEVSCSETDIGQVIELGGFRLDRNEDIHRHIRTGKTGDYARKLRGETIDVLNEKLRDVLLALDYPLIAQSFSGSRQHSPSERQLAPIPNPLGSRG
jgi:hypothetical protein